MESLNIKYRPKTFEEVSSQSGLIKILNKQVETNTFKNCYIFTGYSGTGKTTIARIFSNMINHNIGEPIEIDAASHNGVEDIRSLIEGATQRSLDCEYKIYIIDECHMITSAGWNAFLKCIEEPPKYTIFIFCTTDFQKVPETIINRCQVFNLNRISDDLINNRILYICNKEGYTITKEALDFISKIANGSMRQAISYLDKIKDYDTNITLNSVKICIGDYSYDTYFNLTNSLIDHNIIKVQKIIDGVLYNGTDLKIFISNYLSFILQLSKYIILKDIKVTTIPSAYEELVKYTTSIEDSLKWFNNLVDKVLTIKQAIKGDSDPCTTIKAMLIKD